MGAGRPSQRAPGGRGIFCIRPVEDGYIRSARVRSCEVSQPRGPHKMQHAMAEKYAAAAAMWAAAGGAKKQDRYELIG